MNDKARKKAWFRAKMREHDQRIDSPLVRYNEFDQPVCRICNVVLKSESFWEAHQVSRKHHEAIANFKANTCGRTQVKEVKPEVSSEMPSFEHESAIHSDNTKPQSSVELHKPRPTAELPADFFDNHETKRPKTCHYQNQEMTVVDSEELDKPPGSKFMNTGVGSESTVGPLQTSKKVADSEKEAVRGSLPEGFFDDKDADLRARGIQPVKLDVKDEYKEFEKLIQDDLKEVDERLEEEEFDAAVTIEEAESLEQKEYRERVEMIKKKRTELKAARSAGRSRSPLAKRGSAEESSSSSFSSDDGSDEDFAVDWRAKHL